MSSDHRIHTVRIELSLPSRRELYLRDRCSGLFHRSLKYVIERVFSTFEEPGITRKVFEPLVIDLGELSQVEFDKIFVARLERTLEASLRQALSKVLLTAEESSNVIPDLHSDTETLDDNEKSVFNNTHYPPLLALAQRCLATPNTFSFPNHKRLCQQWAYDVPLQGAGTQNSSLLSALYYCYRVSSTQYSIPMPPKEIRLTLTSQTDKNLMAELFNVKILHTLQTHGREMRLWFRLLWDRGKLRPSVLSHLTTTEKIHIETYLTHLCDAYDESPSIDYRCTKSTQQITTISDGLALPGSIASIDYRCTKSTQQITTISDGLALSGSIASIKSELLSNSSLHVEALEASENLQVYDAGMCLLWPFLPGLFRKLGYIREGRFLDDKAQNEAVTVLLSLLYNDVFALPPERMLLPKLLCGCSVDESHSVVMLDELVEATLLEWWNSLPSWLPKSWKKLSSQDIKQWFLHRSGSVSREGSGYLVQVEPDSFDVFLRDWSWPIHMVALPWLDSMIAVEWKTDA